MFQITREIEEDDGWKFETVYTLRDVERDVTISGNTVKIDVSSAKFITNETYRITMDRGVITFKGTDERIGFGGTQWVFTTGVVSDGNIEGMYGSAFPFKESFFTGKNSDIYNHDLALASCNLAIAAFNSPEAESSGYQAETAGKTVKNLLKKLAFDEEDIDISSYAGKPAADSIAAAIASRELADGEWTLLTVAVRGGRYGAEWGGNFQVGKSGNHAGFQSAANQVRDLLKTYLQDHPVSGNVAVWITGYSRAAATANLLSAYLNTEAGAAYVGLDVDPANIYTYTFETPRGAADASSKPYDNIFNLVNPIDLVPKVAPDEMGFSRYGVDRYFPDMSTTKEYASYLRSVETLYTKFSGKPLPKEFTAYGLFYEGDLLWIWGPTMEGNNRIHGYVLDQFVNYDLCTNFIESRGQYCDELEAVVVSGAEKILGNAVPGASLEQAGKEIVETVKDKFIERGLLTVFKKVMGEIDPRMKAVFNTVDIVLKMTGFYKRELSNEIADILIRHDIVDLPRQEISDCVYKLLNLPRALECVAIGFERIGTLLSNADWFATAHEPEYCLAWMHAVAHDPETAFQNGGKYRELVANCPVDVRVYDSEDVLVAAIIGDEVQKIPGSTIGALIDENGQKIVILPSDEEYRIETTATADGHMTYSVTEYDQTEGTQARTVNYYDVELIKGESHIGTVENLCETEAQYSLKTEEGSAIEVSEDLSGEEIVSCTVTAASEGDGFAIGGGTFTKGAYAKLSAASEDTDEFLGWYSNGQLISTEREYRFCVTQDQTITAKFPEVPVKYKDYTGEVLVRNIAAGELVFAAVYRNGQMRSCVSGVSDGKNDVVLSLSQYEESDQIRVFKLDGTLCPTEDVTVISTLEHSGNVVLYSAMSDADQQALIAGFNEKYPDIEVTVVTGSAGELTTRIRGEQGNPQGDLMWGGLSSADGDQYADIFEPWVSRHDSNALSGYSSPNGLYSMTHLSVPVLIVNEELEAELGLNIQSYEDLLDPALKGKIATADPNSSTSGWNNLSNIMAVYGTDSDEAWAYIEQLMPNLVLLGSASGVFKKTQAGEYVVGLTYEDGAVSLLANGATNIRLQHPTEGTSAMAYGAALIKNGPNQENAKLMISYLCSAEGQTAMAAGNQGTLRYTNKDYKVPDNAWLTPSDEITWIARDTEYLTTNKAKILDHWNRCWAAIY